MNNPDRHSRQAARILRSIGELPGGKAVDIMTRKLPRVLPSEPGSCYHQEQRSYPIDQSPEQMTLEQMPPMEGMDDIVITIHGVVPDHLGVERVLSSARSLLSTAGAQWEWDMRAMVQKDANNGAQEYQIQLFTDAPPAVPSYTN